MKFLKPHLILLFYVNILISQNVGINTTNIHNSAILQIEATDKGLSFPKVSLDSINGISVPVLNPTESLLVWNTNPNTLYSPGEGPFYFQNGIWEYMLEGAGLDACYDKGGPGAGRIIIADAGPVHFNSGAVGNDSFIVSGKLSLRYTISTTDNIPTTTLGDGTICFFDPSKATFRTGKVTDTHWDRINMGRHSFASGIDNIGIGNRTFLTNHNNQAKQISSSAFGDSNNVNGESAYLFGSFNSTPSKRTLSAGSNNYLAGYDSFTSGVGLTTQVNNETIFGTFNKSYPKTDNTGGNDPGSGLLPVGTDSQWAYYSTDRVLAVGYGTSTLSKKNAFEIIKDGRVIINEKYNLPTTDGASDYLLCTNGSGSLTFPTPRIVPSNKMDITVNNEYTTNLSLFSSDSNYLIPVKTAGNGYDTTYTNVPFGTIPLRWQDYDFDNDGKIEIQMLINFSGRNSTTNAFNTKIQIVSSSTFSVLNSAFSYSNANSGIAYFTNWQEINASNFGTNDLLTLQYQQARRNSDGSQSTFTIRDINLLIRDK